MAISDVIKKGTSIPLAGDLLEGGFGIDVTNKRVYSKADDGTIFDVTHGDDTKIAVSGLLGDYKADGLRIYPSNSLTTDVGDGIAYIGGLHVEKTSSTAYTYTASKDTYVDLTNAGVFVYTETAVDAGAPALDANSFRIAKVTSEVDSIPTVVEYNLEFTLVGREIVTDGYKLDGIEALADVTDTTNVSTAGAVMAATTTTESMAFVINEGDLGSNSATKVPTQQSVKTYVDGVVASTVEYLGGYDAATNIPNLDEASPVAISKGDMYSITVGGTFFTATVAVGDTIIAEVNNATLESDWTILNSNLDSPSIKALYEANDDTNVYSDAEKAIVATAVPAGGDTGQVLTKQADIDFATEWADTTPLVANTTTEGLYEMANTINLDYTIGIGNNAISAGPITVATGVSVTVLSGSTWVIA